MPIHRTSTYIFVRPARKRCLWCLAYPTQSRQYGATPMHQHVRGDVSLLCHDDDHVSGVRGVERNVNSITITPAIGTGLLPPLTYGSDVVIQPSGTNHIAARGALSFPFTLVY